MNTTHAKTEDHKIEAYPVSHYARPGTLPRHFGRFMVIVEDSMYDWMRRFSSDYSGGEWRLFELSNGGFYMSPPDPEYTLRIVSNGYEGKMSADAAGITVCLFTFSHLAFRFPNADVFSRHFHRLRDYALGHAESAQIFAAID